MTQKTRIEPLPPEPAGPLTRAMYRIAKRRYGQVPEPFAVAARHRDLMIAGAVHETRVQRASRVLPAGVRELAVFWTARTIGCSWAIVPVNRQATAIRCGRRASNWATSCAEVMSVSVALRSRHDD